MRRLLTLVGAFALTAVTAVQAAMPDRLVAALAACCEAGGACCGSGCC